MIELALKELIEMHASYEDALLEGTDFAAGYLRGLEDAIVVLDEFIEAGKLKCAVGPSKERLLALADKMLVLGSPQSSAELLAMAEKFGV
jgi:hypothetical protein